VDGYLHRRQSERQRTSFRDQSQTFWNIAVGWRQRANRGASAVRATNSAARRARSLFAGGL
jgi:hypothetical protein